MMQADRAGVLKAWAVYFLLKCALVMLATCIGERLGFLVVSDETGAGAEVAVETVWAAWAVYYIVVGSTAIYFFKWTVRGFVVSRMDRDEPVRLSHFVYATAWLVYAIVTSAVGYVIAPALDYAVFTLMLRSFADAPWTGWLRKSLGPIVFTTVSFLVFRWTVFKLLLPDRTASASPRPQVM